MNLKKALVGCFLALSLAVGVLFISNGKGNLFAKGEHYPPINTEKAPPASKVIAEGEHFPPINTEDSSSPSK